MPPILIQTTSDDEQELEEIAKRLVDQRLGACCQIVGPITSFYRWEKSIEQNREWLCLIKTDASMFAAVETLIRSIHHYDVPEIISIPIAEGSSAYLDWIKNSLGDKSAQ